MKSRTVFQAEERINAKDLRLEGKGQCGRNILARSGSIEIGRKIPAIVQVRGEEMVL